MSSELVRRAQPAPASLPEKMEWVRTMASASLLPRQYQNNPGNLLFAVEYADALGVDRMAAITSIHVIEGKPSASADLIASQVRRAGHRLRVMGDDTYAEAHLIRADDPEFTYTARWDVDKARAAGLLGKSVWKSYPGAMLRSRAITEVCRMGASDALFGVVYTPEELGAEVDQSGEVVHSVTHVPAAAGERPTGRDRMRGILGDDQATATTQPPATPPATQTGAAEGSPAETSVAEGEAGSSPAGNTSAAPAPDGITSAQLKKMGVSMREAGLTERAAALDFVAAVIGRSINSRNDLTKDEATRVIDHLERQLAQADQSAEDVVEGEIVRNPNEVWREILDFAEGDYDMDQDAVREDFLKSFGFSVDDADADQLDAYLVQLRTGEEAAS